MLKRLVDLVQVVRWLVALVLVAIAFALASFVELLWARPPQTRTVFFWSGARRRRREREAETVPASRFPPTESLP